MRLTLVSPFDPWPPTADDGGAHVGGVERCYAEMATRLARRGHDVTLLCSAPAAAPPDETAANRLRVRRIPRRLTVLRTPVAALHRHVPAGQDVLQVAGSYPFTTAPVLRRARESGVPAVLDFHFEPAPPGPLGRVAAPVHRLAVRGAFRRADAVLVRSLAYAASAPSLAGMPRPRLHVVPNGVDETVFHPGTAPSSGEGLLFVGRLVHYKGVPVLLDALARMPPSTHLTLVGDGPLRPALERQARRLGVSVTFLGRVRDAALPGLYQSHAVTVLPSISRQEAFGMTLIESMACGTPVVASELPGVAQVARMGGCTAPPGDARALAVALRSALVSDKFPCGTALAQTVHDTYGWEAVVDRLEQVHAGLHAPAASEVTAVAHPGRHAVR